MEWLAIKVNVGQDASMMITSAEQQVSLKNTTRVALRVIVTTCMDYRARNTILEEPEGREYSFPELFSPCSVRTSICCPEN